ncbi:MAG: hypothetical protein Q8941_21535 [Bacteroidota bacterium]|nr:hypothetical protein [Bacteroidota bacterium]
MKRLLISCLLTLLTIEGFTQLINTTVGIESEIITLNYSPTTLISKARVSLIKFKSGDYGIHLFFVTQEKDISGTNWISIDSFALDLTNDKKLILNRPYSDTIYNHNDGNIYWQSILLIDRTQLEQIKKEKIIGLMTKQGNTPVLLHIRKTSQNKINSIANSW